jgi:hypothetical protein
VGGYRAVIFYTIRYKPNGLFVSKQSISYQINSDQYFKKYPHEAPFLKQEKYAKVWTSLGSVKRIVGMAKRHDECCGFENPTWNRYEILGSDGSIHSLESLFE